MHYNKCMHYEVATLRVLGIGTCTCRYFPAEYLVFEVSVKSGFGAALIIVPKQDRSSPNSANLIPT